MSASLVGSEMCIRDRPPFTEALPSPLRPASRPAPHCGRRLLRIATPVSYTHLTLPTICSV
eukprot:3942241-Alexandrium_andersonii.AAC.1